MSGAAFVARFSPWRTLLGIAGCLGFVALGLFLAGTFGGIDDPAPLVGYGSAAVFAVIAALGLRRLGWRGPALRVDAAGIRQWFGARERFVPWAAVRVIEERAVRRQRFLCVWLDTPERWVARPVFGNSFGDLSLSTGGTDRRFADLRAAVERFAPAATLPTLTSTPTTP